MKKSKKVLLVASVFAVAMNMNGCGVYGPPPEEKQSRIPAEEMSVADAAAQALSECLENDAEL